MKKNQLISYVKRAAENMLAAGQFENGWDFRESQRESLEALISIFGDPDISEDKKLRTYYDLATGLGKTGVFLGLLNEVYKLTDADDVELRSVIIESTNLLQTQTLDAFDKFAPDLKERVGLYGGRKRQLKNDITISTYDSWRNLVEQGKLSSDNVDLIVNDEYHKGISDRGVNNFDENFDNRTLSVAFTATARYDDEKTVEKTHPLCLHTVPIATGVQRGELAAYIHTQCYTIRVDPEPLAKDVKEKFKRVAGQINREAKWELKRSAWNDHMVNIYREGRDEHSGDLLSDNIAAFYVADTTHADDLQTALNKDPVLKERAKARGCRTVSIAIHSRMTKTEQEKRLAAFKAGKYLAIIGDDMFKEGFDHPPLKTVFRYPGGSLVDEGQILGRGAREWFNPFKDYRPEGLTYVNTIIYIGSDNREEDEKRKLEARARTILGADILEGQAFVASPYWRSEGSKRGLPEGSPDSVYVSQTAHSQCTMEDMDVLLADRIRYEQEQQRTLLQLGITIEDIHNAILTFIDEHEKRPTVKSEDIPYPPFNNQATWAAINQSSILKDAGYNSLPDYCDKNNLGTTYFFTDYTIEDIHNAIIMYINEYGKKPVIKNEKIPYPPFNNKTTWEAVSCSSMLQDAGYKSLPDYCDKNNLGKPKSFRDYTIEDIHNAIVLYIDEHGDKPPAKAIDIPYPPFNNKTTWQAVNISPILKDVGYKSLAAYCTKHNLGTTYFFKDYTIEDIHNAIVAYIEQHGKKPTLTAKKIPYSPFNNRSSWTAVSGSSILKEAGYKSLSDYCDKNNLGKPRAFKDYTIEDVHNAIVAYINEHGKRPVIRNESITYPPFNNKMNWEAVNISPILINSGYKSLPDYCDKNNLGKPKSFRDYTIEDVDNAIVTYIDKHGKKPTTTSGDISDPPFNNKINWDTVNSSAILKDAGYKSLSDYCDKNNLGKPKSFTDYTIEDIDRAILEYISEHGKRPNASRDSIPYTPFNNKTNWLLVNNSSVLKDAGYKNLRDYCKKNNLDAEGASIETWSLEP